MLTTYIYTLLLPFIPITGALICMMMISLVRAQADRRLLRRILMAFFVSQVVMWFSTLLYNYAPEAFVYFSGFSYFTILSIQVCLFHFVFRITQQRSGERFSCLHYLIPLAIAGVQEVWMLLVPFDVTLGLVESKGLPSVEYPIYSAYFLFKIKMRMILSIVYTVWALVRIYRYRRIVMDYSADEERMSLGWLRLLVFLTIIQVFLPLSMVFHERSYFFTTPFIMPISTLLLLVQFALLCYNFIRGNYVQIQLSDDAPQRHVATACIETPEQHVSAAPSKRFYRERFEEFICTHRPYLNAQLRITDLVVEMGTNRSYLSSFINETYGVNFSQFINRYRMEEYYRMVAENPEANKAELAVKAGFGSYRSFARIERELKRLRDK